MEKKFEVILLEQAIEFLETLDIKTRKKIYYNIDKAKLQNDPKLFKKLNDEIWEFRTKYNGIHYRFLAFWDKSKNVKTLVISTHGIAKKTTKLPKVEIEKAKKIREEYFAYRQADFHQKD